MRLSPFPFVFLAALSFTGCSDDDDAATGSRDGDSGAGDSGAGGSSEPDGGSGGSGSGGESAESGAGGAPAKSGFIGVVSRATGEAGVFGNSVYAGFLDGPGNGLLNGCTRGIADKCFTILCDFADGGAGAPPPGTAVSAGTVTVGGTTPEFTLEYAAMAYATVPAVPTDQLLFDGGETITLAAAGGDVPAFSATLVAPTPFEVTSPPIPDRTLSIDGGEDLVFEWSGSSAGQLSFNVRTTTPSSGAPVSSTMVSCRFDVSAQTGTIPAALLAKLTTTDATTSAQLTTDLSTTQGVVAGDYAVHLAVGSAVSAADGRPYTAVPVTIR